MEQQHECGEHCHRAERDCLIARLEVETVIRLDGDPEAAEIVLGMLAEFGEAA